MDATRLTRWTPQFIADYVYTMREKLEPSSPESPLIKSLRQLRNERRLAVNARTAFILQSKSLNDKTASNRMSRMIAELDKQVKAIEKQIMAVINSDESLKKNYDLLLSIKGIGMINAITTIVATGNFTRFQTARQYAKFCCVAPLSYQSGTSIKMAIT